MKRILFILAAPLLFTPAVCAEKVTAGIKTGMNITGFIGSDSGAGDGAKMQKTGLVAGGYVIFPFIKQFKLQVECLISEKGAIYKYEDSDTVYEQIMKLTYLEIPVLARFDLESRGGVKPAVLFGPSFGIKIGAKGEERTIGVSSKGNIDNMNTLDPGLLLGGVLDIETGKGIVSLEARYTMGLLPIFESVGGNIADIKNSAVAVILGYRF